MILHHTAIHACGHRVEADYFVQGNRLTVTSEYGEGSGPIGGVPDEQVAAMIVRDMARLAVVADAETGGSV